MSAGCEGDPRQCDFCAREVTALMCPRCAVGERDDVAEPDPLLDRAMEALREAASCCDRSNTPGIRQYEKYRALLAEYDARGRR